MPAYTPEIYRRFATPVQLDLGSTATTVDDIKKAVDQIKIDTSAVTGVSTRADQIVTRVDAVAAQATNVGTLLTDTRVDLNNTRQALEAKIEAAENTANDAAIALKAAMQTTADDIVRRVIAGVPRTVPTVNDKSAPLVRLLIQAQAVALDETPDERFPQNDKKFPGWLKNDGTIMRLGSAAANSDGELAGAPNGLQARFRLAFEGFSSNTLPDRAKRFADMHALIGEVTDFLKTP
jgi:hypothetical protein